MYIKKIQNIKQNKTNIIYLPPKMFHIFWIINYQTYFIRLCIKTRIIHCLNVSLQLALLHIIIHHFTHYCSTAAFDVESVNRLFLDLQLFWVWKEQQVLIWFYYDLISILHDGKECLLFKTFVNNLDDGIREWYCSDFDRNFTICFVPQIFALCSSLFFWESLISITFVD